MRCNRLHEEWGLDELQKDYPLLSVFLERSCGLRLEGVIKTQATGPDGITVRLEYEIRITVSAGLPRIIPEAYEIEGRISPSFHRNKDGTLCLGAPLVLRQILANQPTLVGFLDNLLVPYLYNHHQFLETGNVPLGELAHGTDGLVAAYAGVLGVDSAEKCIAMLDLLGKKRRIANKRPCPCGSGIRLGRCHAEQLATIRRTLPPFMFRAEAKQFRQWLNDERPPPPNLGEWHRRRAARSVIGLQNG